MQRWNSHQQMKPSFLRAAPTEWQPRRIRCLWKEELSADRASNVLPQTVIAMWRALPMQCKCGAEQRRRRASSSCVVMIGSQAPLFSSYSVCRASASASSTQSSGRPLWRRRQLRQLFHALGVIIISCLWTLEVMGSFTHFACIYYTCVHATSTFQMFCTITVWQLALLFKSTTTLCRDW